MRDYDTRHVFPILATLALVLFASAFDLLG